MTVTAEAEAAAGAATTSALPVPEHAGRLDRGAAGARLSELFSQHGAAVLGLCRVLLRDHEEAEDAAQQTFLSAYASLLRGSEPRYPAAWLATIGRNECRRRIERRMREPLSVADTEERESSFPDPVIEAAKRANLAALWRAIGELPRRQRQALLLREFSGLSYGELAVALSISEPSVESLLFRARRFLRLRLRAAYGTVGGVAPLGLVREAIARALGGMPDPATSGAATKLVVGPLLAKVATGAAVIGIAGGTVAALERGSHRAGRAAADPGVAAASSSKEPVLLLPRRAEPVRVVTPAVARTVRPVRPRVAPSPGTLEPVERVVVPALAVAPPPEHASATSRSPRPSAGTTEPLVVAQPASGTGQTPAEPAAVVMPVAPGSSVPPADGNELGAAGAIGGVGSEDGEQADSSDDGGGDGPGDESGDSGDQSGDSGDDVTAAGSGTEDAAGGSPEGSPGVTEGKGDGSVDGGASEEAASSSGPGGGSESQGSPGSGDGHDAGSGGSGSTEEG